MRIENSLQVCEGIGMSPGICGATESLLTCEDTSQWRVTRWHLVIRACSPVKPRSMCEHVKHVKFPLQFIILRYKYHIPAGGLSSQVAISKMLLQHQLARCMVL